MKFYLNEQEIKVLNGATFSIQKDETLDSGKIELVLMEDKTPIKPMTDLKIVDNETYNFVVLSDTVEIASKNPECYKHTLQFVQNTKKFSKIQVRNTQFAQPAKNSLKCGCNATFLNKVGTETGYMRNLAMYGTQEYSYSMEVSVRHKVKGAHFKINTYWCKYESVSANIYEETMQDNCPKLKISFDVYKDDTFQYKQTAEYNNNDISYISTLSNGVYTVKNIKVELLSDSTYSEFDLFVVNISLVADVYYYSLYDVLDTLRKQIALKEDNTSVNYVYSLPASGDFYTILKNTIAPNLTFTQCNLFECLEQVFMYLDGYPVLTNSNVLDIRYFNDNNGVVVDSKESDMKMAMSENRFVNGFITDFQNAELNNILTYPSKKAYSGIQNKSIGLTDESSYIMRVDYPIYNLRSVKVYANLIVLDSTQIGVNDTYRITYNRPIELIENIYPEDLYINLDVIDPNSANVDDIAPVKQNCLIWAQKSNSIDVGTTYETIFYMKSYVISNSVVSSVRKMFGLYRTPASECTFAFTINPDFSNVKEQLKYQIEYETLANGRLLIEGTENKYNGYERLDIGQGASDIMKTGLNLLGMSLKTGVDTLVRTEKFLKNEDKIKVGSIYYENGDKYIATKVDECVFSDFVFQTIQYTKNFNKLSQFIALDQKKRFNEIDSSLTLRSEDVYKEYLYFSLNKVDSTTFSDIHFVRTLVWSGLNETFKLNPTNTTKIDYATCNTSNFDGTSNSTFGNVWLPLIQYGAGNALCYEMAFNSPINANSNFKHDDTLNAWYSKYILYTANDGFADLINIGFYNQTSITTTATLPQVDDEMLNNSVKLGAFSNLNYYKKQNETFALNYELLCLPYQNQEVFIGENFIKFNGLIGNSIPKQKLKLFISNTEKYSMFDKYGLGEEVSGDISIVLETLNAYTNKAQFGLHIYKNDNLYKTDKKIVSWAICDENNNIYLSANETLGLSSELICYIFTSHLRL